MDLRGVQDVQRHVLERLRELKSKKSGLSAVLYCKQLSDDKDYDLGCRRLHAFVNDQALKRRLLDCSTAKRYVIIYIRPMRKHTCQLLLGADPQMVQELF